MKSIIRVFYFFELLFSHYKCNYSFDLFVSWKKSATKPRELRIVIMVFRIEEVEFFALVWSKVKFTLRYFDLWPTKHTGKISLDTDIRQSDSQFHHILSFKV